MKRLVLTDISVFVLLVVLGVASRIEFRHLPNFKPVAALALFAGYYFAFRARTACSSDTNGQISSRNRWRTGLALAVPLSIMGISDLYIGGYDLRLMALVYSMFVVPVLAGPLLHRALSPSSQGERLSTPSAIVSVMGFTLASSIAFFLVTNFGCWIFFDHYSKSWSGLAECFMRALPFFRFTIAGDVVFAFITFGIHIFALSGSTLPVTSYDGRIARREL